MRPRTWSPTTRGTHDARFLHLRPGWTKLPYFRIASSMFSLMTSVSRVRRRVNQIPVSGSVSESIVIRLPCS